MYVCPHCGRESSCMRASLEKASDRGLSEPFPPHDTCHLPHPAPIPFPLMSAPSPVSSSYACPPATCPPCCQTSQPLAPSCPLTASCCTARHFCTGSLTISGLPAGLCCSWFCAECLAAPCLSLKTGSKAGPSLEPESGKRISV